MTTPLVPLPHFTFLCGKPNSGQSELAQFLVHNDDGAEFCDFERPLRDGVRAIFSDAGIDGDFMVDLTSTIERERLLLGTSTTVEGALEYLDDMLMEKLGSDYLGRLALAKIEGQGTSFIFDRIIFRDCEHLSWAEPFLEIEPLSLFIHCGALGEVKIGSRHIWLATPGLESRITQLRRELENPVRV